MLTYVWTETPYVVEGIRRELYFILHLQMLGFVQNNLQ